MILPMCPSTISKREGCIDMSRRTTIKRGKIRRSRKFTTDSIVSARVCLVGIYGANNGSNQVNIVHARDLNTGQVRIGVYAAHAYGVINAYSYSKFAFREFPMWELMSLVKKTRTTNFGVSMGLCHFGRSFFVSDPEFRVIRYSFEFDDSDAHRHVITRYVSIRLSVTSIPVEVISLQCILESMLDYKLGSHIREKQAVEQKQVIRGLYAGFQHIASIDKDIALCFALCREQCRDYVELLRKYDIDVNIRE